MSMSDPIADMLTRIRNGLGREKATVAMPYSKLKGDIAEVMKAEGFIEDYEVLPQDPQSVLVIKLKYVGERRTRRSVITGLTRTSKPGRRIYVGKQDVPWVRSGMGIAILTTSKGVMTGQEARRQGVGGELLCKVW
ncbi:MAG: 30S ribosomal protein S8 [Chloroflexota bacterium]